MKRVTGIGGIFFKCKDPDLVKAWYQKHLGLEIDAFGTLFGSEQSDGNQSQYLQWSPFSDSTTYFEPSQKEFMINYRVADLEALVAVLKEEQVVLLDEITEYEYGKFVHLLDIEGNKIELWEPIDSAFDPPAYAKTQ